MRRTEDDQMAILFDTAVRRVVVELCDPELTDGISDLEDPNLSIARDEFLSLRVDNNGHDV